ncbi:PIR protein, fragment [Plasmodium yoelii]|uniref:PIR protein n=2 Tax=Plasmodium yoelii TaxID=5861 RepID=A0AAF0AYQ5_PLAYO|nr:PIR protein, fragment [Plasmodium yoelii]WBY55452.1 PIR protein [Plasmodium yoelii yoelii]VTZ73542.1 PIR protein, fragment [Plasmodium yoelii]
MNFKNNNKEYVGYILMLVGCMLSLKNNDGTNNLKYFYSTFINSDEKYKAIKDATDYKDLIDKKQNLMNMIIIFKFYDAFKILCNIYNEYKKENTNCKNYLKKAKEFVKKYEELNKDLNITEDSPFYQVFSSLSTDYNNLKKMQWC